MVLGAQSGRQAVQATPVRRVVPRHSHLTVQNFVAPRVVGVWWGRAGVLEQLRALHAALRGAGHVEPLKPEQGASAPRPHYVRRALLRTGSNFVLRLYRRGLSAIQNTKLLRRLYLTAHQTHLYYVIPRVARIETPREGELYDVIALYVVERVAVLLRVHDQATVGVRPSVLQWCRGQSASYDRTASLV